MINRDGVPLALGRTQRLASKGQTMALIARDGGCSFPGCTHRPAWCDRHHILDWIHGGPTDLDNHTFCAGTTTPISYKRAGRAASTTTGCRNGSHLVDRPPPTTPNQHPHPTTQRPTQTPTTTTTTTSQCRLTASAPIKMRSVSVIQPRRRRRRFGSRSAGDT